MWDLVQFLARAPLGWLLIALALTAPPGAVVARLLSLLAGVLLASDAAQIALRFLAGSR